MSTENQNETKTLLELIASLQKEVENLKKKDKVKSKRKYIKKVKTETDEPIPNILEEPVVRKVGFRKNIFKDNEGLCREDREFDKKVKHNRVTRNRPAPKQVTNICSGCNRQYKSFIKEKSHWRCSRCVKT